MKKLSILIPAYNAEHGLNECLESILPQLRDDAVEVIVVDDGSTDDTPQLLAGRTHPALRVVRQENRGVGAARNRLLDEAEGEYLWFVDADDRISRSAVELLLPLLRDPVELVEIGYDEFDETGARRTGRRFAGSYSCGTDFVADDHCDNTVWSKVIRRETVRQLGVRFEPLVTGEDFLFSFRLLAQCGKVVGLPVPIYYYRTTADSISTRRDPQHMLRLSDATRSAVCLLQPFLETLPAEKRIVMERWLRHFVSGYLYSLIRFPQYDTAHIARSLDELESRGLYPVSPDGLPRTVSLFLHLFNRRPAFRYIRPFLINRP